MTRPGLSLTRRAAAVLVLTAASASAQVGLPQIPGEAPDPTRLLFEPVSQLAAGLGFTTIDGGEGQGNFVLLQLRPEFDLGSVGVSQIGLGLDAPLRFQLATSDSASSFRFRSEDYDDRDELLSVVRYVRYGRKDGDEALYARFGAVDFGRIGYGTLVEAYRNEVGQDARRRGGEFDLDLGGIGVETLVGSFTRPGVYAGRAFVRPLRLMGGEEGGLNDLTIGVTLAGDLNTQGGYVNTASPGQPFFLRQTASGELMPDSVGVADQGALRAVGVDVGLRIASTELAQFGLYANATRFSDQGTGGGVGLLLSIVPPEETGTRFDARLEAIYGGAGYLPSYFNAFYEVDRLLVVDSVSVTSPAGTERRAVYQSRRNELSAAPKQGGLVAQAAAVFLGFLRVEGRYQQLFETGATGWFHVGMDLLLPANIAFARAGIDRWNIGGTQATNTDAEGRDFSLQAEVGIHLSPYLVIGGIAQRAFSPVYADGDVVDFRRQDRLEPVVRATLPF